MDKRETHARSAMPAAAPVAPRQSKPVATRPLTPRHTPVVPAPTPAAPAEPSRRGIDDFKRYRDAGGAAVAQAIGNRAGKRPPR